MARKVIGWVLVITGVLAVCFPMLENIAYDKQQQELLEAFDLLGAMEDISFMDEPESVASAEAPVDKKIPSLEGSRGIVSIDKINLKMLMFDGVTENELAKGAGIMEPQKDFTKHNIGLAGHRAVADGKQFNRLGELEAGDEIQVNLKSETLHYRITSTFVVHKTDVSVLEDKDTPQLTLVTCTPLGSWHPPDRLIVQAELQEVENR
ncbi:class D sortase [Sporosarcina sp. P20a]|uniref:class D sortase n=1 Tax=Sporosarcina sp. P20a TaxID=2048256 RepID=UPI0013045D63|nr:class D sortase [Sporosarcina sp. P20a]